MLHTTPSLSRAWVVGLKLAPSPARAYRRSQGAEYAFDLGGWASRHFAGVPTRRPASTELEPSKPDRAPDLIGAYGRRTSNTNHVPFASLCIEWTSGASAPECGVAGGGGGCHAGRPASIWDLRSAGRSYNGRGWCIPPLSSLRRSVWRHAPWPLGHVHSASRRPPHASTQHGTKKRRIRETRLGKCGRGDSHAEGGGAYTRRTKRRTTPVRHRAPAALGRHEPRPRSAQCTRRDSALTSHVPRVVAIDPCPRCAVWGRGAVLFLCGVEQTPVSMWRVVVVSGLCARRRAVQIWRGDGPCCGHFS